MLALRINLNIDRKVGYCGKIKHDIKKKYWLNYWHNSAE